MLFESYYLMQTQIIRILAGKENNSFVLHFTGCSIIFVKFVKTKYFGCEKCLKFYSELSKCKLLITTFLLIYYKPYFSKNKFSLLTPEVI